MLSVSKLWAAPACQSEPLWAGLWHRQAIPVFIGWKLVRSKQQLVEWRDGTARYPVRPTVFTACIIFPPHNEVFYARSATDSQDFKTVYRAAHSRFGYRFVFCFCFYKKSLAWKARGRRLPAMGAQLLSPDFLNSCRAIMSIDSDDLISLFFHCLLFQSHTLTCRLWVCRRIE